MLRACKKERETDFYVYTYIGITNDEGFYLDQNFAGHKEAKASYLCNQIAERYNLIDKLKHILEDKNLLTDQFILQKVKEYIENEKPYIPKFSDVKVGDLIDEKTFNEIRFAKEHGYKLISNIEVVEVIPDKHVKVIYYIEWPKTDRYPKRQELIEKYIYRYDKFKIKGYEQKSKSSS